MLTHTLPFVRTTRLAFTRSGNLSGPDCRWCVRWLTFALRLSTHLILWDDGQSSLNSEKFAVNANALEESELGTSL